MTHRPTADDVPGLEQVAHALARVRELADDGPGFTVGICDDDCRVIAVEVLQSVHQVTKLSAALESLGYSMWVLGMAAQMHGCDVIFRRKPGNPRREDAV